jgi:NTP pyrophosphatase (non-canonical NTP hydrolase)
MSETKAGPYSIGSQHWPGTSKLLEEMGELQQVLGKLLGTGGEVQHWDGSNLRTRLIEELADVKAAIEFFQGKNFTAKEDDLIDKFQANKSQTFERWHSEQEDKEKKT